MKKIKQKLLEELQELDSQIENFNPADYVGFFEFDRYLDKTYKPIIIADNTIKVSDALFSKFESYRKMFDDWARTIDKADVEEYAELLDKRDSVIRYLKELDND